MPRSRTHLAFALVALVGLAACSDAAAEDAVSVAAADDAPTTASPQPPQALAPEAAVELLAARDDIMIIDVRTPAEHAEGHLDGTLLFDIQAPEFPAQVDELARDGTYVVYCRTGNRSAAAVERMTELGFVEVYDAGGYDDLVAAGAATARCPGRPSCRPRDRGWRVGGHPTARGRSRSGA